MLVLSVLPCNDGEHGHDQATPFGSVQVSMSADQHGCPQHRHCNDLCSPLCGCHCCSAVLDLFRPLDFPPPQKADMVVVKRAFPENTVALQDMAFAIEHPPQLG